MERDPSEIYAERSTAFLAEAREAEDAEQRARLYAAAVENAIAIVESAKERARDSSAKRTVEREAQERLPHYLLLKDVRIHNFHRRPIPEPPLGSKTWMLQLGPVSLTVVKPGSSVEMTIGANGPQFFATGDFEINDRVGGSGRAITLRNYEFWDPDLGAWVRRDLAVEAFLAQCQDFLAVVRPHLDR